MIPMRSSAWLLILMMGVASAKKPDPKQAESRAHFAQARAFQDAGAYQAELEQRRARDAEEARRKNSADEETRLRRLADEMAQAQAKRRADEAEQQRRRMESARRVGRPYVIAGAVAIAAGVVLGAG